eukprot:11382022-Prorocentrum_lima.AAC.1
MVKRWPPVPPSKLWRSGAQGRRGLRREKSEGQKVREDASENYDELKASGVPEYNIFIREAGMGDTAWIPAGVMAVPRTEKVDSAIYANEVSASGLWTSRFSLLRRMESTGA